MADPASLTSIPTIVKAGDRIDAESGHLPRVVVVGAGFGGNAAVAQLGPLRLSGLGGWLLWLGVHLLRTVTRRARLFTLLNWAWDHLSYDRPVRVMVRAGEAPPPPPGGRTGDPVPAATGVGGSG